MFLKNKTTYDCVICAIMPGIFFGLGMVFIALPQCPHTKPVKKADFKKSIAIKVLNIIYISIFLIGMAFSVLRINKNLSILNFLKHNIILFKLLNSFIYASCSHAHQSVMLRCTNNLIKLLECRKFFGIDILLTVKNTQFVYKNAFIPAAAMYLYIVYYISVNVKSVETILDIWFIVTMSINYIALGSIGLYLRCTMDVYTVIFRNFFKAIENSLQAMLIDGYVKDDSHDELRSKMAYLRIYYLKLCCNYKKHILSVGNILFYVEQFLSVVVISVLTYLYYTFCARNNIEYEYIPTIDLMVIYMITGQFIMATETITRSVSF